MHGELHRVRPCCNINTPLMDDGMVSAGLREGGGGKALQTHLRSLQRGPTQLNYSSHPGAEDHHPLRPPPRPVQEGCSVNVSVLPVREVPSWDCWGCVGGAACEGMAETPGDPG